MPSQVVNYQCPACTGPLHFNGKTGKLKCDYCESEYDVSTIETLYADKEKAAQGPGAQPQWNAEEAGAQWGADAEHIRVYSCPSCGAELVCDDTTAATACPYCGNPTVVPGQLGGSLKPDLVIPFKLGKEDAIAALKKHYKGKPLLPKSFAAQNHLEEIKGVYVPFWLFDCDTHAQFCYDAEKVTTWTEGDYDVRQEDHYRVTRQGTVCFEKVPVDGSSKMPDTHMDAIEPFDYSGLKPFSTAYLPGFMAEKYDQDADASVSRANDRIRESTAQLFDGTLSDYTTYSQTWGDIQLHQGSVKYALLPVWMLASKWNGKDFLFAMNAQTGKLIGDLPIDKKKQWGWFFGLLAGVTVVVTAILSLM